MVPTRRAPECERRRDEVRHPALSRTPLISLRPIHVLSTTRRFFDLAPAAWCSCAVNGVGGPTHQSCNHPVAGHLTHAGSCTRADLQIFRVETRRLVDNSKCNNVAAWNIHDCILSCSTVPTPSSSHSSTRPSLV